MWQWRGRESRLCVGGDRWVRGRGVWEQATEDRWPGGREQKNLTDKYDNSLMRCKPFQFVL